jgi:hypothetical protein
MTISQNIIRVLNGEVVPPKPQTPQQVARGSLPLEPGNWTSVAAIRPANPSGVPGIGSPVGGSPAPSTGLAGGGLGPGTGQLSGGMAGMGDRPAPSRQELIDQYLSWDPLAELEQRAAALGSRGGMAGAPPDAPGSGMAGVGQLAGGLRAKYDQPAGGMNRLSTGALGA